MAEYYACDIKTISNWMRRRILPFVKVRRLVRFDVTECDRALQKYKRRSKLLDEDFLFCDPSEASPKEDTATISPSLTVFK